MFSLTITKEFGVIYTRSPHFKNISKSSEIPSTSITAAFPYYVFGCKQYSCYLGCITTEELITLKKKLVLLV